MTRNPAIDHLLGKGKGAGIGEAGRAAERRFARRVGGKETPASGAGAAKGDVRLGDYLIEHKATTGESLGLKLQWLRKVAHEATMAGRRPALAVSFSDETGRPRPEGRWVMIPEEEWRRLVDDRSGD